MHGYSDRINHALAFAAKHHDRQVRKGMRPPYLIKPANVAIILTRYGRDEDTLVAGILHDVIADYVRDGYSQGMLEDRLAEKFGLRVLETVLAVTPRRTSDHGDEFSADERRADQLDRLARAGAAAQWVCVADKLHSAASLAADLRRTIDAAAVWARSGSGRDGTVKGYRDVHQRLASSGFDTPIMEEFNATVEELEMHARTRE